MTLLIAKSKSLLVPGYYLGDLLGLAPAFVRSMNPTPFRRYKYKEGGEKHSDVIKARRDRLYADVASTGYAVVFTLYCVFGNSGEFDLYVKSDNADVNGFFDILVESPRI